MVVPMCFVKLWRHLIEGPLRKSGRPSLIGGPLARPAALIAMLPYLGLVPILLQLGSNSTFTSPCGRGTISWLG
jgi:hypothetical protein